MYKVVQGDRPERPSSGFSDTLWELLVKTWDTEDGPKSQKRPSVSIVRGRLQEDVSEWGKSVVPLSPEGGAYPMCRIIAIVCSVLAEQALQ